MDTMKNRECAKDTPGKKASQSSRLGRREEMQSFLCPNLFGCKNTAHGKDRAVFADVGPQPSAIFAVQPLKIRQGLLWQTLSYFIFS